ISKQASIAGFALALALLAGVAAFRWRHLARMEEASALVTHTERVRDELQGLLTTMVEIETGQRGFVLTGEPAFLPPLEEGVKKVADQQRRLESLIRDSEQKASLAALQPLIAGRIAFAQANVQTRQSSGIEAAVQEIRTFKGKELMDQIRAVLARMGTREQALLDDRRGKARHEMLTVRMMALAGTTVSFALLITVFALRLRENRLRRQTQAEIDRFFALSLDMLCIARADGYFKRISPAFTQTLGWSEQEILARPFLDFVHPDDRAATVRVVETLGQGQPLMDFENRYQHKDGSWHVVSWKAVPEPGGLMYATGRDITERKRAEAVLRFTKERLELAVKCSHVVLFQQDLELRY
ncbi:MAG: CHASE3 domain-containing protein, partial [Desulfobacterales bacterium]|nr:CHASE3 domain-containing protein [Desulfobacterales bacterium]